MMRIDRRSLTFRLILGASLLCAVTLVVAYLLLTALFDLHLKNNVDAELADRLDDLAAGLEVAADGVIGLPKAPDLPKYDRQLSGHYRQIAVKGQAPIRSRSLWDARLPEPRAAVTPGAIDLREISGPRGETLRLAQRVLKFDPAPAPVVFSAAADLAELEKRLDELHTPLQERLRAYEKRVAELEKSLAAKGKENRQLLEAKIQLTRKQMETERARSEIQMN